MNHHRIPLALFLLLALLWGIVSCGAPTVRKDTTASVESSSSPIEEETTNAPEPTSPPPDSTPVTTAPPDTTGELKPLCRHNWRAATCTEPALCLLCAESDGEPLGHTTTASCLERAVCTTCGEVYAENGSHHFTEKRIEAAYLASPATIEAPASYYYTCSVCSQPAAETFPHGLSLTDTLTAPLQALTDSGAEGEYYLYFSDPHPILVDKDASFPPWALERLARLGALFDASRAEFAICGGDWFNNSNSREGAISTMKQIRREMTEQFGEKSYLVLGNHDTNYQVYIPEKEIITESDQRLTEEEIVDAWFPEYGKTYYSFTTSASRFYVFDCGIDWWHMGYLTNLDREQIAWYLEELSRRDDKHIVLSPHMVYITSTDLHPAIYEMARISAAYNTRGSIIFNGTKYDFSQKTGTVEYIIAGHLHADQVGEICGIPYVLTANMSLGDSPTADFVLANYTERKLRLLRTGEGEDREVTLPNWNP